MSWEVFLVLNLTITAPAVALFLTYLTYEIEERIFRGEGTRP
mgnify:CR=1 FL=1